MPNAPATRPRVKWSWKVGAISGIAIYVHATFVILVGWLAWAYWLEVRSLPQVLWGVALFLALFGCVLLHELGHALTAQRFGLTTRQITLLPIGGIATLEHMPADPVQSLWITLAGPAVNALIATVLFIILEATGSWEPLARVSLMEGPFLERLMLVNVSLLAFNMLPAFPMDGGRVLRALLATRLDDARATRIAARLGQAMAVLFGIVGWLGNPVLVLIAVFVWIGATEEATMAELRSALRGVPVRRVMMTTFRALAPDEPLSVVVDLALHGAQHDFPVTRDGKVLGVLTQRDLLRGLAERGSHCPVGEAMQRAFVPVAPSDSLDAVLGHLEAGECSTAPVLDHGRLAGLLTAEGIAEFLRIQAVLAHTSA